METVVQKKKERFSYPNDFDEKIKELLESDNKQEVKMGIFMLLRQQGFYVGKGLWAENSDSFHPALHILLNINVRIDNTYRIDNPDITLHCMEVMYDEASELGIPMRDLISGRSKDLYSYGFQLSYGVEKEEYYIREHENSLEHLLQKMSKVKTLMSDLNAKHKNLRKEIHTIKKRLTNAEVNNGTKERLETLAEMHKKMLSKIMVFDEDETEQA